MENEQRDTFIKVLEAVLEQLAFMFGEAVTKDEMRVEGEKYLHVNMKFKGKQSGNLGVAIPADLSTVLASNILGLDEEEEVPSEKAIDALKEFLNIVCGQLLTTVYGDEPVFDLTVPKVSEIDKAGWEFLIDSHETIGMMVEDVPLIAHASF